jgi:hypothetical protein
MSGEQDGHGGASCSCHGNQSLYPTLGGCSVQLSGFSLECRPQGVGFQTDPGCGKTGTLFDCKAVEALGFTIGCSLEPRGTATQACH